MVIIDDKSIILNNVHIKATFTQLVMKVVCFIACATMPKETKHKPDKMIFFFLKTRATRQVRIHQIHISEQKHCSWERKLDYLIKRKRHMVSGQRFGGRVDWELGSKTLQSSGTRRENTAIQSHEIHLTVRGRTNWSEKHLLLKRKRKQQRAEQNEREERGVK